MSFVVIYDANVLYPAPLRDLLIRIALTGIVRARWTNQILDECFRNVLANRPDLTNERLQRTRKLMNQAVPDCLVTGYEPLVNSLKLPDPDDRHVLAAAIRAGAQTIVTFNLRDFPRAVLAPFEVEAKPPDEFVLETLQLDPAAVCDAVRGQHASLKNPPKTLDHVLDTLQNQGLPQSVTQFRQLMGVGTGL